MTEEIKPPEAEAHDPLDNLHPSVRKFVDDRFIGDPSGLLPEMLRGMNNQAGAGRSAGITLAGLQPNIGIDPSDANAVNLASAEVKASVTLPKGKTLASPNTPKVDAGLMIDVSQQLIS